MTMTLEPSRVVIARPAGPHLPAPSAGSPRRPEPPIRGLRARFSLQPALALLVGALSLFAAAPAKAQTPATVTVSASPNPVPEGGSVTAKVVLSRTLSTVVTIPLTVTAGSAESGDYTVLTESFRIGANRQTFGRVIQVNQDTDEDDETLTIALGTLPSSVTAGSPSSVEIMIRDDDKGGDSGDGVGTPPPTRLSSVSVSCDPCEVPPGGEVRLKATASDPDGDALTYRWRAKEGSILWLQDNRGTRVESRSSIRWQAPPVAGRYQVTVVVTDGRGATGSSTVEINVNTPPTVSLSCEDRCRVRQGIALRLEAQASDADGHELSYSWSAESGSFVGETDGPAARWRAPAEAGAMTVRVMVSDAQGGSASAETEVAVDPLSHQSAVFASYLLSLPNEDSDQVIDTYISVSNVLSAPVGVETAGSPYEGDDKVGTLEIHLYSRDGEEPIVHETTGDSPGDGLDENGRLAPGQTYIVRLSDLVGEDSGFVGYGWIVGNFDGIAGTRTIILGQGMAWHGDLTPKLSHHGAGVKPIPTR